MDGELNETTPKNNSYVWNSTSHTIYETATSTNISMTRDMDMYQRRPQDTTYLPHPSWKTVQREKERQKQPLNQKRPRRQEPPWQQKRQPPQGQHPRRKQRWPSPQRQGLHRKQNQQPPQRQELQNKYEPPSKKRYDEKHFEPSTEKHEFTDKPPKFSESNPHTSNSALTWAEAVSSLSIEDPNAAYDPSEPTLTEFDMPDEDPLLPPSIIDRAEIVSPYLEVAIFSVPATDLTEERSKMVNLKIGDLAESWAANSNSNISIAFVGAPMYSEKDIGLYVRCQNGDTVRWLEGVVSSLDPLWDGCKLLVRKCELQAKLIKCFIRLPISSANLGLVCRALRGFNPSYQVQTWQFYSFHRRNVDRERAKCCIVVGIPEDIVVREILPNQRKVKYRLGTGFVRFFTPKGNLVNKYPPIDKVDDASSSVKENPVSADSNKTDSHKANVCEAEESPVQAKELQTSVKSNTWHSDPSTSEEVCTDLSDRATSKTKNKTKAKNQPVSSEKKEVPKPRWWTPDIEEKRRWMRHLFNRAKNTKRDEDWLAHKRAQNEYKKLLRAVKHTDFQLIRD